jgi:putative ABC transport system ATP-binding protein
MIFFAGYPKPMIDLLHVFKTFHSGDANQIKALDEISLHIKPEEFLVIVGANGSGKSTLLNAIAGNITLDKGQIHIENKEVTKLKEYERSVCVSRIFQNPFSGTAPDLSIIDNFRLAALRTQSKKITNGINSAFKKKVQEKISFLNMGLENKTDQLMGTLSGGQRQALTLMMAVMDTSKILLLDEPTAALDPKSSQLLMEKASAIISEYKLTAVLITHALKEAHLYGNRIIQMQEGKIIRDLNKAEKESLSLHSLIEWFA